MKTIVCDIDGTIANLNHRLHHIKSAPKNWRAFFAECENDTPYADVISLVQTLTPKSWCELVFVSGRSDEVRNETTRWLRLQGFTEFELYMRRAGDHRPDWIVKQRLYEKYLKNKDIWFVLDDRDQVVNMWRSNGIRVLQVANGAF